MTPSRLSRTAARLASAVRMRGLKGALLEEARTRLVDQGAMSPLAQVNQDGLLDADADAVHARQRREIRTGSLMLEAGQVEASYPLSFERGGRVLRYAFLPASRKSKGLVVLFHGHDAFLHLGPMRRWRDFDVLAPWDTFGYQRQGSWFWGERGDNFVELMVQALIEAHRANLPGLPWFCTGSSMGGFGALYHGVKYECDGLYVMCPQVDLAAKIREYGDNDPNTPYGFLRGDAGAEPDLLALAQTRKDLPPLFLIQYQYDFVNPFAEHAFRLLDIYNRKKGWYGIRVYPSVSHGGDGRQEEAETFFNLILEKGSPRVAEIKGGG